MSETLRCIDCGCYQGMHAYWCSLRRVSPPDVRNTTPVRRVMMRFGRRKRDVKIDDRGVELAEAFVYAAYHDAVSLGQNTGDHERALRALAAIRDVTKRPR